MSDRTLTCRDCGQEFVFTAGEQEFYQQRGFSEPQRCRSCRDQKKAQRNAGGDSYQSSGGYGGGYGNRGSGGSGYSSGSGDGGGQQRQLFPATCSECGAETQVPFNPTPGKPVYCRNCFTSRRTSDRYNSW
ncbi:MAG TPA: zinc-ribbon domain containing protein [Thermomicrobiales bacterium]|nr:zinc-ribbon domain containing protein [Thermomicrobiales bacterium]